MHFFKGFFLCLCLIVCSLSCATDMNHDLEEITQDFFIDVKQICIPDFPHAFNPSLVKWRGHWLMSFRLIDETQEMSLTSSTGDTKIGLIYLDEAFNPISDPEFIFLEHPNQQRPFILMDDARLITCEDRLYIVNSGNKEAKITENGFRMYVAELDMNENGFYVVHNECLSIFEGSHANRREKNWVPFIYEDELLLTYGMFPHKILRPLMDESEECETVATTLPSLIWEWGELRGGTPSLKLDDDHYLGFFHSSIPMQTVHSGFKTMPHYFMGAYLFSSQPPFEIKYISPEPIIGKNFYHGASYAPYWRPVCVIFPCGLIINEDEIWITFGRQDHEIWIAKLDKLSLLESLIHVSTCFK